MSASRKKAGKLSIRVTFRPYRGTDPVKTGGCAMTVVMIAEDLANTPAEGFRSRRTAFL